MTKQTRSQKSPNPSVGCSTQLKCSNSQLKCSRPGPVTNNAYLNFLRDFRKTHCGLKPREVIMKAARSWNRLCESKKKHYRRMAGKVSALRKKHPVCKNCMEELHVPSSASVHINLVKGRKKPLLKGNSS